MATTVQEIQTTLSSCLPSNNLRLQVNQIGNQLSVVINRPSDQEAVNYDDVADVLLTKLRSLSLPNVTAIKLYGRPANTKERGFNKMKVLGRGLAMPSPYSNAIVQII